MNRYSYYLLFWVLACLLCLVSCSKSKETEILTVKAHLVARYLTQEDTVYIGNIGDMEIINGKIMISEFERGRFLVFDQNFRLDTIVGSYGQGPDQFWYAGDIGSISIDKGTFFVHDVNHGRLRVYNNRYEFLRDITLHFPEDINNFALRADSIIYTSTDGKGNPIVSLNQKNGQLERRGEFFDKGNNIFQKINRSQGFVFNVDGNLIMISNTEPLAKVYDGKFSVISELDLSNLPVLKNSISRGELIYKNSNNTILLLFEDAYLNDNDLYLTTYEDLRTNGPEKNFGYARRLNGLIKIKYSKVSLNLEIDTIIDLSEGDGWYEQVIVVNDKILAYDGINNEVHEFVIP